MRLLITTIMLLTFTAVAGDWGLSDDIGLSQDQDTPGYQLHENKSGYIQAERNLEKLPDTPAGMVETGTVKALQAWTDRMESDNAALQAVDWDVPTDMHTIAEASIPINWDALDWFEKQGYNAVMVGWKGQPAYLVQRSLEDLHKQGWTVLFAHASFSGKGIYIHPDRWRSVMQQNAEYIDAVLPVWRVSSGAHWQSQSEKYSQEVAEVVRSVSPTMPLIGEAFFKVRTGEVKITGGDYASAIQILNAGKRGIIPEIVIDRTQSKFDRDVPVLYNIVGPAEHYTTKFYNSQEARQAKASIRERALNNGAEGTVTFFGDAWQGTGLQTIDK